MKQALIKLIDGTTETIFDLQDFEWLVDKWMGFDSVRYMRAVIEEVKEDYEAQIEGLKEKHEVEIENLKLDNEADIEELNDKIADLESEVKHLEERIDVYEPYARY